VLALALYPAWVNLATGLQTPGPGFAPRAVLMTAFAPAQTAILLHLHPHQKTRTCLLILVQKMANQLTQTMKKQTPTRASRCLIQMTTCTTPQVELEEEVQEKVQLEEATHH